VGVVGLLLGAAGAWWWTRDAGVAPQSTTPAAVSATDAPVTPVADTAPALPPLDRMDTFLRALFGALSSNPAWARWLATDDLIRQMANGIDVISRGASPAKELASLRPPGGFTTAGRRGSQTIDPVSYRRFDGIVAFVTMLDPQMVADAYRTIQPRLDEAYRALGRSESGVDAAVAAALQTLIDTPTVAAPLRVVPGPGASYVFADPDLERLPPAQKQLLRMGPENADRIRTRLREIHRALETPSAR
jgi:hypothetical protein